ncbi:glycosyltransferase family 4 protein [candidate division KSB1 bacterium]
MKILHIIYDDADNPWLGGGGALRAREINHILAKENTIIVLTGSFPGARNVTGNGIRYVRVGAGKNYFLSRFTFMCLIPFYIRKFECDIIINDFSIFSPCFCQWYSRKPVIHLFHHYLGNQVFKKFLLLGIFAYFFEKLFLYTAKYLIAVSPSVAQILRAKGKAREIRCIHNGVDIELFNVPQTNGAYIAFLGRLDTHMKGLDILLESFSRLSDKTIVLKIAGSGQEKNRTELEKTIIRLNLDKSVALLGRISDYDKKNFLAGSLFLVLPSRFEGWGIAAIEAAACGKAVVGTDIPGLRDAVVHNKTGILVESGNVEMLTDAMELLCTDEQKRKMLGMNGREWAHNFRWDTIARKQEEFYRDVIDSGYK